MKWSVVVVAKDMWETTKNCLDTLVATAGNNLEIVYVDNGSDSTDAYAAFERWSAAYSSQLTKSVLIPAESVMFCGEPVTFGAGLSKAWNIGVSMTTGERILIINNDLIFLRQGWLEQFDTALNNSLIGVVGMTGMSWKKADFVQGSILALRRGVYDDVGPFDEWLEFSVEEVDYCLRTRSKGYHVQAIDSLKNTYIQHLDALTRRAGSQHKQWFIQYKAHESRLRFCYKWPEITGAPSVSD